MLYEGLQRIFRVSKTICRREWWRCVNATMKVVIVVMTMVMMVSLTYYAPLHTSRLLKRALHPPPNTTWPPSQSTPGGCTPRHNVMFLKTHKCASSTTQRIFLRYGKTHGLTQVLPLTGNYLGSPLPFKAGMIPRALMTPDHKYNMMVVHTRLDVDALHKVMKDNAAWVTIVREPVAQFESVWSFFNLEEHYKMPIAEFATQPYSAVVRDRRQKVFGIHQMFFDLGYSSIEDYEPGELMQKIKRLNDVFDLVMIAERYDESLILLKNLMCWTTEDIAYLKINDRKRWGRIQLFEETKERLRHLNHPDVKLYKFFYNIFDQKVKMFGEERMQRELNELFIANERLKLSCLVSELDPLKASHEMDWVASVNKQVVRKDNQTCVDLAKTEHSMLNEVRNKQKTWVEGNWKQNLTQIMMKEDPPKQNEDLQKKLFKVLKAN
ncbi:galactosylceramide sulfotransferase-like [Homarus americanus]|uniref:galactosylceramide sulfotransferase-like n=1 Tax=Homarus americanus TaxID=6706 RepID=UPI001C47331D|nr:galactosylceramide sulfotransferase-like [Homarus americanus]